MEKWPNLTMNGFKYFLLLALGSLPGAYGESDTITRQTLSVGVVPQQSASELARLWTPILVYLSGKTGYDLRFKTATDIPTFERRVLAGEYDLAYMNPYHYTVFHQKPGYEVFIKEKDRRIKGIIVVRKDSAYQDVVQLKGRTIAFPAPAAFAASVLPRAYLSRIGVSHDPKYVSSHDSVYRAVAKGLYSAGGGIRRTFENMDPAIRDQLRILWTTPDFTPHAFAAHPRVPKATVRALSKVMIEMHHDSDGAALLAAIGFKGLIAATNTDYNDIRALNITLLQHLLEQ